MEVMNMTIRILILSLVSFCTLLFAVSPQAKDQEDVKTVKPRTRARAETKITVHSSEAKPYDQTGFEGDFGKGSDGTLDYWFE